MPVFAQEASHNYSCGCVARITYSTYTDRYTEAFLGSDRAERADPVSEAPDVFVFFVITHTEI